MSRERQIVTVTKLYMSSAGILREVRTVTGGLNHRPTDSLPKDRRHGAHIMVRGSDRDSLVVLPGTRDIKESGAYVQRGSMSRETQDTPPRRQKHLDLLMPESEDNFEGGVGGACIVVGVAESCQP